MKKRRVHRSRRNTRKLPAGVLAAVIGCALLLLSGFIVVICLLATKDQPSDTADTAIEESVVVREDNAAAADAGAGAQAKGAVSVKTAGAMQSPAGSSERSPAADEGSGREEASTPQELPQPDGTVTGARISSLPVEEGLSGENSTAPAEQGEGDQAEQDPEAPAEDPAQAGGEAPAEPGTENNTANNSGQEAQAETPPVEPAYSPEEEAAIAAYYSNTVLAGDSVMLGFRNYCRSGDAVMQGLNFLVAGSYSLHNAFWPVGGDSVHPLYQGQQRLLWESIQMIGPNRVFLFFGINDMVYGIEDTVAKYHELIDMIKSVTPDVQIVIMSTTYTLAGQGGKNLNNTNIASFNQTMAAEAAANGWGFVDIATPTSDGNGNLLPAYCSDGYLHQSHSAYTVWEKTLKDYALVQSGLR